VNGGVRNLVFCAGMGFTPQLQEVGKVVGEHGEDLAIFSYLNRTGV
jgi:hypothetical protein